MTYKEAITNSMEKISCDAIELPDGTRQEAHEIFPIVFPSFLINLSGILAGVALNMCLTDVVDVDIAGEKQIGNAKENPDAIDIMQVLCGSDLVRGLALSLQFNGFTNWLLEQEAQTEDIGEMWYDGKVLSKLWNDFALRGDE